MSKSVCCGHWSSATNPDLIYLLSGKLLKQIYCFKNSISLICKIKLWTIKFSICYIYAYSVQKHFRNSTFFTLFAVISYPAICAYLTLEITDASCMFC